MFIMRKLEVRSWRLEVRSWIEVLSVGLSVREVIFQKKAIYNDVILFMNFNWLETIYLSELKVGGSPRKVRTSSFLASRGACGQKKA